MKTTFLSCLRFKFLIQHNGFTNSQCPIPFDASVKPGEEYKSAGIRPKIKYTLLRQTIVIARFDDSGKLISTTPHGVGRTAIVDFSSSDRPFSILVQHKTHVRGKAEDFEIVNRNRPDKDHCTVAWNNTWAYLLKSYCLISIIGHWGIKWYSQDHSMISLRFIFIAPVCRRIFLQCSVDFYGLSCSSMNEMWRKDSVWATTNLFPHFISFGKAMPM